MNQLSILLCLVVIAATVQTGTSVSCYVCNSGDAYQGSACVNPESHANLIANCDDFQADIAHLNETYKLCRKFVQDVDGDYRIVRSCATKGRVGRCIDRTGTTKIKLQYCECENTDPNTPCNAGHASVAVGHAVVGTAAGAALLWLATPRHV